MTKFRFGHTGDDISSSISQNLLAKYNANLTVTMAPVYAYTAVGQDNAYKYSTPSYWNITTFPGNTPSSVINYYEGGIKIGNSVNMLPKGLKLAYNLAIPVNTEIVWIKTTTNQIQNWAIWDTSGGAGNEKVISINSSYFNKNVITPNGSDTVSKLTTWVPLIIPKVTGSAESNYILTCLSNGGTATGFVYKIAYTKNDYGYVSQSLVGFTNATYYPNIRTLLGIGTFDTLTSEIITGGTSVEEYCEYLPNEDLLKDDTPTQYRVDMQYSDSNGKDRVLYLCLANITSTILSDYDYFNFHIVLNNNTYNLKTSVFESLSPLALGSQLNKTKCLYAIVSDLDVIAASYTTGSLHSTKSRMTKFYIAYNTPNYSAGNARNFSNIGLFDLY